MQMLATFGGPEADGIEFENKSYRSQVAFGHGEASVMAGDDKGRLWVWDLVSVSAGGDSLAARGCSS